ncbi:MAG: hypothetical protein C0478_17410 [Planctomyces sp.]|nr:hypothetical protein [Planctomyces sp.]
MTGVVGLGVVGVMWIEQAGGSLPYRNFSPSFSLCPRCLISLPDVLRLFKEQSTEPILIPMLLNSKREEE